MNSISQAEKTALDVLIVILKELVKLIKELNLLLNHRHPSEVKLEKQKESQDAFTSNHNLLMLKKFQQRFQEHLLLKQNRTNMWIVNIVKSKVQHRDECLLNSGLAVVLKKCFTELGRSYGLEDVWKQLWIQFANVAESDGSGDADSIVPLDVAFVLGFCWILFH